MTKFQEAIIKFNKMYGLLTPARPVVSRIAFPMQLDLIDRLRKFKSIMLEEIAEVDVLIVNIERGANEIEILTELADWLGDLQVYCASEMAKFGLDNDTVLSIIMESNMSKLAEDGSVLTDARGKVMKGPKYWKPEPVIKAYIEIERTS